MGRKEVKNPRASVLPSLSAMVDLEKEEEEEMTKLELAGTVDTSCDEMWYGPRIGGVNVIERIDELWPHRGKVKVYLGIEPQPPEESAAGKLGAGFGFSGTEVTPGDAPIIMVGGFDLMDRLEELDDREVLLIIEDE